MTAWICYLVVAIVWGSTYFAIAYGIESFTTYGLVASRYLPAGALALLLGRLSGEPWPLRRDLPHLILQGLLLLTLSNALITWAEAKVASSVTAVLCATTPLFYVILGRERLGWRTWAGLALGLAGVALLARSGDGKPMALLPMLGILLATALWAYGTLHGRRHVQGKGLMGNVGVQMLAGGTAGLLLTPFNGGFLHAPLTRPSLLAMLYLMVFGSLLAYSAFVHLSKVWSPTRMSTYVYLNPIVAVVLGWSFRHEPLGLRLALGVALMLAGVALVQFRSAQPIPADD